jgi:hypothetical protein
MDIQLILQFLTFILCGVNYTLNLYRMKWDFGNETNIGWLMATLGWMQSLIS